MQLNLNLLCAGTIAEKCDIIWDMKQFLTVCASDLFFLERDGKIHTFIPSTLLRLTPSISCWTNSSAWHLKLSNFRLVWKLSFNQIVKFLRWSGNYLLTKFSNFNVVWKLLTCCISLSPAIALWDGVGPSPKMLSNPVSMALAYRK